MKKIEFNFRLQGIDLIEKILYPSIIKTDNQKFNFQIKTQSAIDHSKNLILILIEVEIFVQNASEPNAKFTVAFSFEIQNFENVLSKNDSGLFTIPIEVENLLKNISLSSMRGIIFSELRGTVLHQAIMPIVDADSLKPVTENILEDVKKRVRTS